VQWLAIVSLMVCSPHIFVLTPLDLCQEYPAFFALSSSLSLSQYLGNTRKKGALTLGRD